MTDLEQRVAQLEATVHRLLELLVSRGDMSINDAREAIGLKPFRFAKAPPVAAGRDEASVLRDLQLASGIITEEEHALLTERDKQSPEP